jgi:hypothetical protein
MKCARDLLDAAAEIARLRSMIEDACKAFDHYDLPEHAFHYRRQLNARSAIASAKGEKK